MNISFVIPCYRSEKTIKGVVSEIQEIMGQRPDLRYEIIMVSDHSPDKVYSVIEQMCHEDPSHLKGIELVRNFGQHSALMAGYAHSSGDVVFSLDDDGQAPVESIFTLIDKLDEGFDVVYGAYPQKKHHWFRCLGSKINDLMMVWLLGKPVGLQATSFYTTKRFVIDEMLKYEGPFPYLGGLIFRITKSIGNVDVKHRNREEGESGYTLGKLIGLWMNGFTAFSIKPLRLASYMGMSLAFIGFLFGIWVVVNKLFIHPDAVMGYSSMMSVMLFIGGMLMLMLGLIGEYVGRIYICINKSPQYVISRKTMNKN